MRARRVAARLWKRPRTASDCAGWPAALVSASNLLLSLVAVVVSLYALTVSRESMVVGQRAYPAVTNGEVRLGPLVMDKDVGITVPLISNFSLANMGLTPADIRSLEVELRLPQGWSIHRGFRQGAGKSPTVSFGPAGQLAPNESANFFFDVELSIPRSALQDMLVGPVAPIPRQSNVVVVSGRLNYENVFRETLSTSWCWEFDWKLEVTTPCR